MKVSVMKVNGGENTAVGRTAAGSVKVILAVLTAAFVIIPPIALSDNAADPEAPVAPIAKGAAGDVAALVAALSSESFPAREKATEDLWKMGPASLPALHQAAAGADPEAADRANELILYISAGVLFDSTQEVKTLVLKFSRSNVESKLVILRKLMGLGQWKQVLHLAKREQNPDAQAKMSEIVKTTASRAARDAIVKGDLDLAGEILEMSSDDTASMLMRAWFHLRRGQIKQQLDKAASLPGKQGALWRMSLHRVTGNIPASISEAEKAGRQDIADSLRVLQGNAMPLLVRNSQQNNIDVIYSMGCKIQRERQEGRHKQAAILARELARLARDEDSTARATICLAANGFRKEALDLLVRKDLESAFQYYDSIESPERCLETLGIPKGEKAPYTAWVKKFTANAIESEDEKLYNQLLMLASFLRSHGQEEHTITVLTPVMAALEADGSDEWFDLLTNMTIYGLGAEAIHFIQTRSNEDGEGDLGVKKLLRTMPSKSLLHVWETVKKRNNQDLAKALHDIGLLSGIIADTANETDKLHKALVDEVADKVAADKDARMAALFSFAIKRNDIDLASRMADNMAVVSDKWVRSKTYLDAALFRWKKIEPYYAKLAESKPGDYYNLTNWYVTLRKLGRDKGAEEVYQRVLMFSMGDSEALSRIGWELHEAGFEDDAVELWQQALMLAEPGESDYDRAIVYLAHYGQSIYRKKQWKKAAAIAEVNCQLMMRGRSSSSVLSLLRTRFYADFCNGMHLLTSGDKSIALAKLNAARQLIPGDGSLADEFFPALRHAGIGKYYNEWFEDSYRHVEAACKLYPKAHNSQNTAAWLASRSVRRLDDALKHAQAALKIKPVQGAYLDTMAEVWFARGKRAKAIEWSEKAVAGSIVTAQGNPRSEQQVITNFKQLHKQLQRFKNDPLPK